MESAQTSKTAHPERTAVFVIILVVVGALIASYWFISSRHKSSETSTIVESSSVSAQKTKDNDLRTTAKELSGDVGIIKGLTDGSTKGSIIVMVIFSVVGMGYFAYGKKSQQLLMVICGIALMGYSYFVAGTLYIILIGVGLSALPFILGRK
jgi:tellurite resistance protein TehA-like permease